MANRDITAPSYQEIRKGNNHAIEDAIRGIYEGLIGEISSRLKGQTKSIDRFDPKVLTLAPTAAVNNLDYQSVGTVNFTGSTAVDLTGIIAPERDGAILIFYTTGSATITVKHQNAGSDAANRIITKTAGDRAIATDTSFIVQYLSSRWRELNFN